MAIKKTAEFAKNEALARLRDLEEAAGTVYSKLVTERRWFTVTSAALVDFWEKRLYYYAGHFTYNALLAMLAMLLALTAVVGIVLRADPHLQGDIRKATEAIIPVIGGTPSEVTRAMVANSTVVGIVGFFGLLWTGSKLFGAIEYGFCIIWDTKKRAYLKRKTMGLLMIFLAGVIVILSVVIQLAFAAAWGWMVGRQGFWYSAGTFVLKPLIGITVNFALFLFIYQVIPPVRQTVKRSAVGAAVSAVVFVVLQYLLAFYFGSISKLPSVYGSLATIVVLVVWLHLTGMVIFLGAEIIHALYDEQMVEGHTRKTLSSLFKYTTANPEVPEPSGSPADGL